MYILNWKNPSIDPGKEQPIDVPVGSIVSDRTSISLTGKGAANYGVVLQTDLLRLLENFADYVEPENPTVGQTWFDASSKVLKVCVGTSPVAWKETGGIQVTYNIVPSSPSIGDLWINRTGNVSSMLMVYTGLGRHPVSNTTLGGWEQIYPAPEIVAGREEYDSMLSVLRQFIGNDSGGNTAIGKLIDNLPDMDMLDQSLRTAYVALGGNDTNVVYPANNTSALKVDPVSQDWDALLAAAKYALNRLNLPDNYVSNISSMPFIRDGLKAPDSLLSLPTSDIRYPAADRLAQRKFGSVTLHRLYTETYNTLSNAINQRYSLRGVAGETGPQDNYWTVLEGGTVVEASYCSFLGVMNNETALDLRLAINFDSLEARNTWIRSGGVLESNLTFTTTDGGVSADFQGLTEQYGILRATADTVRVLSRSPIRISLPLTDRGLDSLGTTVVELVKVAEGGATYSMSARSASDTRIEVSIEARTLGVTGNVHIAVNTVHDAIQYGTDLDFMFGKPNVFNDATDVITKSNYLVLIPNVPAVIEAPYIIAPAGGAADVSLAPNFVFSGFTTDPANTDIQTAAQLQISRNPGFTDIVFNSGADTVNKQMMTLPWGTLVANMQYYARVRFYGTVLGTSAWGAVTEFETSDAYVQAPTLTVEGAPYDVVQQPLLTGSAFTVVGGTDNHLSTNWQIRASNDVVVWESLNDSTNLTSIRVPYGILNQNTQYKFTVQYLGRYMGASAITLILASTNASFFDYADPANIGRFHKGGYFVGRIKQDDGIYALIVAPKSAASIAALGPGRQPQGGNTSDRDGLMNTQLMVADTGSWPAAEYCDGVSINGYSDWYLPAKNEFEICYRNLKPTTDANSTSYGYNPDSVPPGSNYTSGVPAQTANAAFKTGAAEAFDSAYYWSSSVIASSPSSSWGQNFGNGGQYNNTQSADGSVRPVRREKISDTPIELLNPGDPLDGGYFSGLMRQDDGIYALIVSPKSVQADMSFSIGDSYYSGSTSKYDGKANTAGYLASGEGPTYWSAPNYVKNLTTNGYSDWYIPALHELQLIYSSLKPTTDTNSTSSGANPYAVPPRANYTASNPSQVVNPLFRSGGAQSVGPAYIWTSTNTYNGGMATCANIFTGWGLENGTNVAGLNTIRPVRRKYIRPVTLEDMPAGTFTNGGYLAGIIQQADGVYAIIAAPKSTQRELALGPGRQPQGGNTSDRDGLMNTQLMVADAGSWPAAEYCDGLTTNGYSDWYLPAKNELEILYRKLKPTTDANSTSYGYNPDSVPAGSNYASVMPAQTDNAAFKTGAAEAFDSTWYWSSTVLASSPTGAWHQYFGSGIQVTTNQSSGNGVRPIRRVKIR